MRQPSYAIITPAHNEAAFLPRVIRAVAAQTWKPSRWVIVDDRSTDATWRLLTEARQAYPFIHPVRRTGKVRRELGAHVVRVFNDGLPHLHQEMEYLVKLDADILLPEDYFETLLARFQADRSLGMASGKLFIEHRGAWIEERFPDFHVTGACKTYRMTCFRGINGLLPIYGWDILDGARARMLGWETRSFRDLAIRHLRMTGSEKGMLRGHIGHGRGMYAVRALPLFVLGRAIYRALEPPHGAGLLILLGYALAWMRSEPRLEDLRLAEFLRREQLKRLLGKNIQQEVVRARRRRQI
ncbi:MAG: glycosyltransferase family A protein [Thermodesulfobacteriota bacterium]